MYSGLPPELLRRTNSSRIAPMISFPLNWLRIEKIPKSKCSLKHQMAVPFSWSGRAIRTQ